MQDAASRRLQVGVSTRRKRILGASLARIDGVYQIVGLTISLVSEGLP